MEKKLTRIYILIISIALFFLQSALSGLYASSFEKIKMENEYVYLDCDSCYDNSNVSLFGIYNDKYFSIVSNEKQKCTSFFLFSLNGKLIIKEKILNDYFDYISSIVIPEGIFLIANNKKQDKNNIILLNIKNNRIEKIDNFPILPVKVINYSLAYDNEYIYIY